MNMHDTRWRRDERQPVWQQVEQITSWRGDEAKSIAYRMEWDGLSLEQAIQTEVREAVSQFGILPDEIDHVALYEHWGVMFCAGIVLHRPQSVNEQHRITTYIARHVPIPPPSVTLAGVGRATTETIQLPDEVCRVLAAHTGRGNFMLTAQPVPAGYDELLVNRVGAYRGATLLQGKTPVHFRVNADGAWTITIEALPINPPMPPTMSGMGDTVSDRFLLPQAGSQSCYFTHKGRSNFMVTLHSQEQAILLQNVIGPTQQHMPVNFPAGLCWWEIKAESSWRIEQGW